MRGRAMVACLAHNQEVGGSSPSPAPRLRSSSGLGHRPFTAKITGSNPVRSTKFLGEKCIFLFLFYHY